MPDVPQDDADGKIETEVARLPEPQRAPARRGVQADALDDEPALSEEELRERQAALGVRRKPAGPPRRAPLTAADDQPSDVPETEVTPADGESE